ncbi:O-antigen ligase family protein [Fusobacterium animalis]|uniref:O-antigen ligase family protein n=1 Tax=Fusobacterium animalis TaxID=76859 RepID=UPI0030D51786
MNKTKDLSLYKKIFLVAMLMSHGISIGKLYLYHIFLILNIVYIFSFLIQNGKIEKSIIKRNKVIFIFFLYSFLHCFFVKDIHLAFQNQVYIICGISVFFSIKYLLSYNSVQTLNIIKKVIYFAIFIAILEILKIYRWYNSGYELSFESPSAFLGNINNFATVIIIVMPFIFFMKNNLKKIFCFLLLIYILISCDSRANNIALAIEIFIYFLIRIKEKKIIYKIGLFLLGLIGLYIFKEKLHTMYTLLLQLINSDAVVTDSVGVRKAIILNLIDELKKINVFLFGIGGGNSIIIHMIRNNTSGIFSNHSFFLEILVEYGIFIFLVLSFFYISLIMKNYKNYKENKNTINGAVFISLIGFAIGLNSISTVIYFFSFWIILGIADFYAENKKIYYRNIKDSYEY